MDAGNLRNPFCFEVLQKYKKYISVLIIKESNVSSWKCNIHTYYSTILLLCTTYVRSCTNVVVYSSKLRMDIRMYGYTYMYIRTYIVTLYTQIHKLYKM